MNSFSHDDLNFLDEEDSFMENLENDPTSNEVEISHHGGDISDNETKQQSVIDSSITKFVDDVKTCFPRDPPIAPMLAVSDCAIPFEKAFLTVFNRGILFIIIIISIQ